MRKIIIWLSAVIAQSAFAQSSQVNYTEDFSVIANPERGFYRHTETSSLNYSLLNSEVLRTYRDDGITQILRVFYLENFREEPISDTYLNNMRKDFAEVREAGIKAIIRFAYTKKSTAPYGDAPIEQVLIHLEQLSTVLHENQDVIASVQAGFVGAWGEWYYTDYFSEILGGPTEEDWANRRALVIGLTEAVPETRFVQLRTPQIKTTVLEDQDAIEEQDAFDSSLKSRLGHHNDCFVASSNDIGTYYNPEVEKPYLEQETQYLPMGGETCGVAPPYSDCDFAASELERFHWSYLNIDYHPGVLEDWAEQGCFDEIEISLGYRYQLISATATNQLSTGNVLTIELDLLNEGYSNPYNAREVEIVLKNKSTEEEWFLTTDQDPRLWTLNSSFSLSLDGAIPEEMPEGNYDVYLNLPDPFISLYGNSDYSIRVANIDTWQEDLGYNDLLFDVEINNESENGIDHTDESLFQPRAASYEDFEIDTTLLANEDGSKVLLFWSPSNEGTRIIERSSGLEFDFLASIPASSLYYYDLDIVADQTYQYRTYVQQGSSFSNYSDTVTLRTDQSIKRYVSITNDGNDEDWSTIPPLLTSDQDGDLNSIRLLMDTEMTHIALYGEYEEYEIYLNTDNNEGTGAELSSYGKGFDYLINSREIQSYQNGVWEIASTDVLYSGSDNGLVEISLSLDEFSNLGDNRVIRVAARTSQSDEMTYIGQPNGSPVLYARTLPVDAPSNLIIQQSSSFPLSRLRLSWSSCSSCNGLVLERSTDGTSFTEIASLESSTTFYTDQDLSEDTHYFYRLASFNDIGLSDYSEIVSASTLSSEVLSIALENEEKAYPNPTSNWVNIPGTELAYSQIKLFDISGRELTAPMEWENGLIRINLAAINSTVILIKKSSPNGSEIHRIVRY